MEGAVVNEGSGADTDGSAATMDAARESSAVPARLGLEAVGLRRLWLPQHTGQAKAANHGLALANLLSWSQRKQIGM